MFAVSSPTGRIHSAGREKPYYGKWAVSKEGVGSGGRIRTVPVSRRWTEYANLMPARAYM